MVRSDNSRNDNETFPLSDQRVAIFIDGSNLYHSLEENCGRYDLNFGAFTVKLTRSRTLFRAYYYNVLRDQDRNAQAYQDQQKFLAALYNTPYLEVRLGTSKVRGEVTVEKGVDIMIATDMLRLAWEDFYDIAVLVSGDGDFAYAVQTVKDIGKYVEIVAFQPNLSPDLLQAADDWEFLSPEFFDDLWSRGRGRSSSSNGSGEGHKEKTRRGWRLGRIKSGRSER